MPVSLSEMQRFGRINHLNIEITDILKEFNARIRSRFNRYRNLQFIQSYFGYAWSIEQAAGVDLKWRI